MFGRLEVTTGLPIPPKDLSLSRLEKTCKDFESIFITHMLKSMRSALVEDGYLGNSNESRIMKSMFDENLAIGIARGGGIGIGRILFQKLMANYDGSSGTAQKSATEE